MTDAERIAEAERAAMALDAYLGPAFTYVEQAYLDKLTNLAAEAPWEAERITKLATALKIARTVRAQIEAIARDGQVVAERMDYARQIEKIPAHKRSILGL